MNPICDLTGLRFQPTAGATYWMPSINQNVYDGALPSFRNLGIVLRILVLVNGAALAVAAARSAGMQEFWQELINLCALVEPLLFTVILVLVAANPLLRTLPYWAGVAFIVVVEIAAVWLLAYITRVMSGAPLIAPLPLGAAALCITAVLLHYFHLRGRALSPALAEARLQALQARIRPHFLFNSINAVLSLIRSDPRRAETALEDLADLFRTLMADNRQLTPLAQEVDLCRRYLDIEQLRLGDRLKIVWRVDKMPGDALIPPLVLQPLLENAVYHGVEPQAVPGEISIDIFLLRDQLHAVLKNPYLHDGGHHGGNKMALANIRERLALHFDVEASLTARLHGSTYQVHIVIPYVKAQTA